MTAPAAKRSMVRQDSQSTPNAHTSIAACICTMCRPDDLRKALASLAACEPGPDQILVSDDSPADDYRVKQVCDEFPSVEYARSQGRGLAANRNAVLRRVSCDWVHFLDDDTIVPPSFYRMARAIVEEQHGQQVVLSGRERKHHPGEEVALIEPPHIGFWTHMRPSGRNEPNCAVINAALFPRSLFCTIRFDTVLKYGYEEADITLAAIQAGYRLVYVPALILDHYPSPINREAYQRQAVVSAVYAGIKRHAEHRRKPLVALAFACVAVPRLIVSRMRKHGVTHTPTVLYDCASGVFLYAARLAGLFTGRAQRQRGPLA